MKSRKGFTLVEILIVVVILGILAAIVIPQFSQASTEAREASLVSNLQSVRAQIELYKIQHNDEYPGNSSDISVTPVAILEALTGYTNIKGEAVLDPAAATSAVYGRYMKKMPANPFNQEVDANRHGTINAAVRPAEGTGTTSWGYDSATGDFYPNDNKENSELEEHATL